MKFKIRLLSAFTCLLLTAQLGWAAAPDVAVASLNRAQILSDSKASKDALARFQADFQPKEKALQDLAASLKDKSAELDKAGPTLSPAQLMVKQNELTELSRELKRKQQQFVEDRDARRRDDIQHIFHLATLAAKKVAVGKKISLVFQDVVYTNPKNDITVQVIQAMDASPSK